MKRAELLAITEVGPPAMSEQLEPLPDAVRHVAAALGQDSYNIRNDVARLGTGPTPRRTRHGSWAWESPHRPRPCPGGAS
jgi:hypothetical protein